MGKCLVTKLNGSTSNSDLLRLGEMRMKILKVQTPTDHTQGFSIGVNKAITLEIVSDGYFTDKTLTKNNGKTITLNAGMNSIWVNGDNDVEIAILDKYSLSSLASNYVDEVSDIYGNNIKLNFSDLKYSLAMNTLSLWQTQVSGDIGDLKALTGLTYLNIRDTQVSGDIGNLKALTNLTILDLSNTQVSGDIGNLKALTNLTYLSLSNPAKPLFGDIDKLSNMSKCTSMSLNYCKLTGDLAALNGSCIFVSFNLDKGSVFTWSTRPSTAKILAIEGNARITNVDKMLQDQAQCQVGFSSESSPRFKTISVAGNRTSASDDAVATLQQKGYTISIAKA